MKSKIILILIILFAFFIRFWGFNFGLPDFHFLVDENFIVHHTFRIIETKKIVTPDFVPPMVYYRLLILFYSFVHWLEKVFSFQIEMSPSNLMTFIGRLISVVAGSLTVYFVYKIGKEMFNKKIGLLAAFFFSVTFVHLAYSRYVKYDITATFWGTISFLYAFYILRATKSSYYFLAGIFVGITISTHFIYVFFLIPPLVAFWLKEVKNKKINFKKIFSSKIFLFSFGLVLSFFVINPYLLVSPQEFFRGIEVQRKSNINCTMMLSKGNISSPFWYLFYLASSGLYYPIFLAAVLGILILARRREKRDILLLSFPFFYLSFLFLNSFRTDRLTLPSTPFFALYSAIFIENFLEKVKEINKSYFFKKLILVCIFLFFFALPLIRVVLFSYLVSQKDTRQLTAEWIEKNFSKEKEFFIVGDAQFIGTYLMSKGFSRVVNLFPLEDRKIFLHPGEIVIIDSVNYRIAKNYQNLENNKKFWENYQIIRKRGKLIKEFSQPLFKAGFFSPTFLEHSSTVNAYHNPVVEIYEIPKIEI